MSEKWKQKILLIFPFAVLAAGMILTAAFFLHTYRQIAFEHTSALCETILANSPEAEPQLLAALKDYHSLTEQELRGNDYLEKYGYRVDDFCYDFPLDTVRHKCKAAALAETFRSQCQKHHRNNGNARQNGHHGINGTDKGCALGQIFLFGHIGTVGHHNSHAYRQREKGLTQRAHPSVSIDRSRPDREQIPQSIAGSRQCDAADYNSQQNQKQTGHQKEAHFFNSLGHAAHHHINAHCQKQCAPKQRFHGF